MRIIQARAKERLHIRHCVAPAIVPKAWFLWWRQLWWGWGIDKLDNSCWRLLFCWRLLLHCGLKLWSEDCWRRLDWCYSIQRWTQMHYDWQPIVHLEDDRLAVSIRIAIESGHCMFRIYDCWICRRIYVQLISYYDRCSSHAFWCVSTLY